MERDERNIYIRLGIIIAVWLIAEIILLTRNANAADSTKNAPYSASDSSGEYFIAEDQKIDLRAVFDDPTGSGMPCENPEQFRRWYEEYEQETSKETEKASDEERSDIRACETDSEVHLEENLPTDAEMETEAETETAGVPQTAKCYSINGEVLNPELQAYLYQRLADHHIEWFMPYAVMVAYQESHFDYMAVNLSNGIDCGLFQFRAPYYEGQDIFNPYEQIDIFTQQMANRANSGRTVSEMISAHNMSDYGNYNQTYVNQVMAHSENLREVK